MVSTLTGYTLIARDLAAALRRKAAEPAVARETAYYQARIGQVRSVDALMADRRLYAYAVKAYGLEDMTYARAFMRKVLSEGAASRASFANRLADDRYVALARAFDFTQGFSAAGRDGTISDRGPVAPTPAQMTGAVELSGTLDFSGRSEVSFSLATQCDAATTRAATIVLNRTTLAPAVRDLSAVTADEIVAAINGQIAATGEPGLAGKVRVGLGVGNRLFLETTASLDLGADGAAGGTGRDADTVAAAGGALRTIAIRNVALSDPSRTALDIGFGTALGPDASARSVTDAYLRQSLESDAGAADTGVRLALYFARKAPTLTSAYDVLGDAALSQVANTVVGLPATSGAATREALERRAGLIAAKIDIASFRDPAKLAAFVRRFAALWDARDGPASAPVLALFGAGAAGVTAETPAAAAALRTGR
ncbi:hypothetical protein OPKNFCMD_5617 [Methylobacterium crusticola]|uniref:DUF1217 domain-containing protein n=1 Tax=Methylobacterium crusticola TaxID=1697972 RepID=A0ABQ4R6R2_9HYPH|nr:DUF1217 domain-containing protein [Methylobacterium crusticola]GJD52850.1 hypothetical protein OPKNFCMD_5617 [Methylobacterium crusticola]